MHGLRREKHSAKLPLPSLALGEEMLQVPNGHLGTSFAEIFGFAEQGTRRRGAKWSPGSFLRRAVLRCREVCSAKEDPTWPFGTTVAEPSCTAGTRRRLYTVNRSTWHSAKVCLGETVRRQPISRTRRAICVFLLRRVFAPYSRRRPDTYLTHI